MINLFRPKGGIIAPKKLWDMWPYESECSKPEWVSIRPARIKIFKSRRKNK